jgi:diaminopimelate epimerase
MRFAKLQGLGNDFVLVDLRGAGGGVAVPDGAFATRVCDRHFGVGADGVLTLLDLAPELRGADLAARMVVHNADGSRPEMCGNGARCAALWIASAGCSKPANGRVLLLTDAGARACDVTSDRPVFANVEIGMGAPKIAAQRELGYADASGIPRLATPVSMGNPHLVFFTDAPAGELAALCDREGPPLCKAEDANIEFVTSLGPQRFAASVWERGAGATLACGTGACAVAAAAIERGLAKANERIEVVLPGGSLFLRLVNGEMKMRGPAELSFTGSL